MQSSLLSNKVALVTGASRGIGREVALAFAQAGATVVINYRTDKRGALELSEQIKAQGGAATVIQGDVSDEKEVEDLFEKILALHHTVDILVNNAGISKDNLLLMTSAAEFDEVMKTNMRSVFLCSRAALKIMSKQRKGAIINLSSIAGIYGNYGQTAYAASKAAILGFTKSAAKEAGTFGITVNAVAPGFVDTDMTSGLSRDIKDKILEQNSLKRFGTPKEVANVVLFLASPLSAYINGQIIEVDGGQVGIR